MRSILLFLICLAATSFSQSGRSTPVTSNQSDTSTSTSELSVKQMFDEANGYIKAKAAEYDAKKVRFSDTLFKQAQLEQRQLAAKYAASASQRKELIGEDFYYLGMLHWIA